MTSPTLALKDALPQTNLNYIIIELEKPNEHWVSRKSNGAFIKYSLDVRGAFSSKSGVVQY